MFLHPEPRLCRPGEVCCYAGLEAVPLAGWAAIFAASTFVTFVLPVVGLWSAELQVRYWYGLVLLGAIWAVGLLCALLHESPVAILRGGGWLVGGVVCFAVSSAGLYLPLLRFELHLMARKDDVDGRAGEGVAPSTFPRRMGSNRSDGLVR